MSDHHALLSLAVTLLGALIVSTWRGASLSAKLLAAVQSLEEKDRKQDERLARLDEVPINRQRIEHLERNHSLIPKLFARVETIETKLDLYIKHSREMRAVRQSRPDPGEVEE